MELWVKQPEIMGELMSGKWQHGLPEHTEKADYKPVAGGVCAFII